MELTRNMRILLPLVFCGLVVSGNAYAPDPLSPVAERYVHLVLALGQHDPDYVDAFYGPAEWKTQAEKEKKSLDAIGAEAAELRAWRELPTQKVRRRDAQIAVRIFPETGCRAGIAGPDVEERKIKVRRRVARALRRRCANISPSDPDSHFDQIIQLEQRFRAKVPYGSVTRNGESCS